MSLERMSVLTKLKDLHKQATEERSHYYTGSVIKETIAVLEDLLETVEFYANREAMTNLEFHLDYKCPDPELGVFAPIDWETTVGPDWFGTFHGLKARECLRRLEGK